MKKLIALALIGLLATAHAQQIPNFGGAMVPNGGGSGGGSGSVTSVAAGCGTTASPSPITTTGSIAASITSRTVTGASDTVLAADCGNVVYYNSASAVAVSQPAPTGSFANGFFTTLCNINSGLVTITPGSGTILGGATFVLQIGTASAPFCAPYQSNGTNFNAAGLIGSGSGVLIHNGTIGPTLSSGQLAIGGIFGTPVNPAANGEGQCYLSTANGLICQGQGSTNDMAFLDHGGTERFRINGGNFVVDTNAFVTGFVQSQNSGGFGQVSGPNSLASSSFVNSSSGASAQQQIQIGNNTSGTEATLTLNSSANTGGNGANSFTITGAAGVWLQGGTTNGLVITSAGIPQLPSVTTGTPTASLCLDASNNIIKKTTAGSCI